MKKSLLLLGALIFVGCLSIHAEKSRVVIESYQTGHVDRSTAVRRTPMRIPIDVYYDEELHQIEISGDVDMNVQIYLYDENENIITYSLSINTILDIPDGYSGLLSIRIESDNWGAIGRITIYNAIRGIQFISP